MDNYFNMARAKQAYGLRQKLAAAGLGSSELLLLMILARKMGREDDLESGQIKDGCRAALETLEAESLMERKAIGAALARLTTAGFLIQTMDRDRRYLGVGELTKEGLRRQARGLSLHNPAKNNYVRKPIGHPRKNGKQPGQWKHCVYHLVPEVWDSVVFETRDARQAAQVSPDQRVLDDPATTPEAMMPAASAIVAPEPVVDPEVVRATAEVKPTEMERKRLQDETERAEREAREAAARVEAAKQAEEARLKREAETTAEAARKQAREDKFRRELLFKRSYAETLIFSYFFEDAGIPVCDVRDWLIRSFPDDVTITSVGNASLFAKVSEDLMQAMTADPKAFVEYGVAV